VLALSASAIADNQETPPSEGQPKEPGLEALERRIAALEEANRQLSADRKRAPVVKVAPGSGLSVGTADGRFTFQIRARARADPAGGRGPGAAPHRAAPS
jgi:hypothetical protein